MTAEIKKIERGYPKHVVDILEGLLEKAKQGEMAEIVVMYKTPDRTWAHEWSGTDNTVELIGAFEVMKEKQLQRTYK